MDEGVLGVVVIVVAKRSRLISMSARFSSREQARVFRALESFTSLIYTSDLHRSPSLVEVIFLRTFDWGCVVWWYFLFCILLFLH